MAVYVRDDNNIIYGLKQLTFAKQISAVYQNSVAYWKLYDNGQLTHVTVR